MKTLSQRQLLLALLDRQLLLQRSALSIPEVLESMGGLQAQYAPSMYVGLWTRMSQFSRADLDAALSTRSVVEGTLLRSTIHLVSAGYYWVFATAIRESRKQWWLRSRKITDTSSLDDAAKKLRAYLRQPAKAKAKEIEAEFAMKMEAFNQWIDLVRVPPSGTWARRRADLYAFADDWIPRVRVSVREATDHLVRRYLGAFGPATPADIANWAGIPPKQVLAAIERMAPELTEYDGDLIDLADATIPYEDTPIPVRFLPVWDATLLVHCRRTGILPEEHRSVLFNSANPQSFNTFLVDGQVAGTWKHSATGIQVSPFRPLSKSAKAALESEAEALASLYS